MAVVVAHPVGELVAYWGHFIKKARLPHFPMRNPPGKSNFADGFRLNLMHFDSNEQAQQQVAPQITNNERAEMNCPVDFGSLIVSA